MTRPDDDDRHRTLVGQPLFDASPTSPPDAYRPPPRRPGWLVPLIVGLVFALVGVLAIFAWLVVRDDRAADGDAAASTSSAVVQAPPATPTTAVPGPTGQSTVTLTRTPETPGAPSAADWYAQLGAFNDYDNAVASRDAHAGSQLLPGSAVGSSSEWIVVMAASSQNDAAQICARYGESSCYVRTAE